ncbi:MAG: DUF4194 domain-containing protein [Cytophagaceae bacterium]|jgi:hypothetical protein|nr:DUF4194 domain-containing protein [Cytophagaceae bacterium]
MSEENNIKPYSKAIVRLLKGTVDRNNSVWNDIISYQKEIQDYISVIGLELILKKNEGFAFVKQFELEDGLTLNLVSRRPVGFETSIVLVVLRQILEEFDSNPTEIQSLERFITHTEIKEEVELFFPERNNIVRSIKDLDSCIKRAEELGFLKEVKRTDTEIKYQIHRIIKEKITLNDLQDFKNKLQEYV